MPYRFQVHRKDKFDQLEQGSLLVFEYDARFISCADIPCQVSHKVCTDQ